MTKPLQLFLLIILLSSCNNTTSTASISDNNSDSDEISEVSDEKKKILTEIKDLQINIDEKNFQGIADFLDTPKRIEEIELNLNNSKIRNAIESSSSRLSIDLIRSEYDLLYDELDLGLINETLNQLPENDLLEADKAIVNSKIGECEFETEVSIKGKEVKFNIKSTSEPEECKKDQQWKFISNGESLVLDRRYYL